MADTTNIFELPTDPAGGGGNNNNVSLSANEMLQSLAYNANSNITANVNASGGGSVNGSLDQTTISQIVNGIQQASSTGATQLPSRDIPLNTDSIMNDAQIQPNYIPAPQNTTDYIKSYENHADMIDNYNKNQRQNDRLDEIYEELQFPILVAILFFLFQLPIFKQKMYVYLPFLFFKDGNYNLQGFIFTSSLFGFLYYILSKTISYFSIY